MDFEIALQALCELDKVVSNPILSQNYKQVIQDWRKAWFQLFTYRDITYTNKIHIINHHLEVFIIIRYLYVGYWITSLNLYYRIIMMRRMNPSLKRLTRQWRVLINLSIRCSKGQTTMLKIYCRRSMERNSWEVISKYTTSLLLPLLFPIEIYFQAYSHKIVFTYYWNLVPKYQ